MLKALVLILSAQGGWSHGVLSTPTPRGCTPRGTGFQGLPYCSEFNGFGPNIVIAASKTEVRRTALCSTHACMHARMPTCFVSTHACFVVRLLQGATTAADAIVCNGQPIDGCSQQHLSISVV